MIPSPLSLISGHIESLVCDCIHHKGKILLEFLNLKLMNLPTNFDVFDVICARQENFGTFGHALSCLVHY